MSLYPFVSYVSNLYILLYVLSLRAQRKNQRKGTPRIRSAEADTLGRLKKSARNKLPRLRLAQTGIARYRIFPVLPRRIQGDRSFTC